MNFLKLETGYDKWNIQQGFQASKLKLSPLLTWGGLNYDSYVWLYRLCLFNSGLPQKNFYCKPWASEIYSYLFSNVMHSIIEGTLCWHLLRSAMSGAPGHFPGLFFHSFQRESTLTHLLRLCSQKFHYKVGPSPSEQKYMLERYRRYVNPEILSIFHARLCNIFVNLRAGFQFCFNFGNTYMQSKHCDFLSIL